MTRPIETRATDDICTVCKHGEHELCNGAAWRSAGWEVLRVPCACAACRQQPKPAPIPAVA